MPFIDTSEYVSHIETFGVPVVQDSDLTAPLGDWPEGFIAIPELGQDSSENKGAIDKTRYRDLDRDNGSFGDTWGSACE